MNVDYKDDAATSKKSEGVTGASKDGSSSKPVAKKRIPVRRTKEQEKEVYNRTFIGCGAKSDYDVLTKLGEGTFGCVSFNTFRRWRLLTEL